MKLRVTTRNVVVLIAYLCVSLFLIIQSWIQLSLYSFHLFLKGVTIQEFKAFNRFLNNIDDFIVAMRMFNMMHEPIAQGNSRRVLLLVFHELVDGFLLIKLPSICNRISVSFADVFIRAVKVSTGEDISPYLINVVFQLFDIDGK